MSPATVDTLLAISLVNAVGEREMGRGRQGGFSSARCRRTTASEREMYKIVAIFSQLIGQPQGEQRERERKRTEEREKLIKMLFSLLFTQQIASNAHKSNCSHRSKDADAILGATVNSIFPAYFMCAV